MSILSESGDMAILRKRVEIAILRESGTWLTEVNGGMAVLRERGTWLY